MSEIKIKGIIGFDRFIKEKDPQSDKYTVRILMSRDEAVKLKEACNLLAKEHPTKKLSVNIVSGSEKKPEDENYAGRYYINCKSKFDIKLVGRNAKPVTDPKEIDDKFYSGVDAIFAVSLYVYNHPSQGSGIGFGISGIQSLETGERIAPSGPSFEAYEPVDGFASDDALSAKDLF